MPAFIIAKTDAPLQSALITNDAVVLGIIFVTMALIFRTAEQKSYQRFYRYLPPLFLCYLISSVLGSLNIVATDLSGLNHVVSYYLLPAGLVLLCLSIDFKTLGSLLPKTLTIFMASTLGIILGGPLVLFLLGRLAPDVIPLEEGHHLWEGMGTLAGRWIGGESNQMALAEHLKPDEKLLKTMLTIDMVLANIWAALFLYTATFHKKIDRLIRAQSSLPELYKKRPVRSASPSDIMLLGAIAFGVTALAHLATDGIMLLVKSSPQWTKNAMKFGLDSQFFWIVLFATLGGLIISSGRLLYYDSTGAFRMGKIFLYFLIFTLGLQMNLSAIIHNKGLFLVGLIWAGIHLLFVLTTARIIRAPFALVAIGSQANIGGAASASMIGFSFHPCLAPLGVLLATLGYLIGTYGAMLCVQIMKMVGY